jgi:hypothetical protein
VSKTEKREVGTFTSIEVHYGIQLEVIADKDTSVEVTTDDNRLGGVPTRVEGSQLKIGPPYFNPSSGLGIRVKVTAPEVTAISVTGVPDSSNAMGKTTKMKIHLRDGGHATVSKDGHISVSD